jgi:hypothetical protein
MKMFNVHDQIASQVTGNATIKALFGRASGGLQPPASSGSRIWMGVPAPFGLNFSGLNVATNAAANFYFHGLKDFEGCNIFLITLIH